MKQAQMMEAQSHQNSQNDDFKHRYPNPQHMDQYDYQQPSPPPPVVNNENLYTSNNVSTRNDFIDMLEAALEPNKQKQRLVMDEWKKLSVTLHIHIYFIQLSICIGLLWKTGKYTLGKEWL